MQNATTIKLEKLSRGVKNKHQEIEDTVEQACCEVPQLDTQ